MFELNHVEIRCENSQCPRGAVPYAFLNLSAGDVVQVVCPSCGWVSTIQIEAGGRRRIERRSGAEPKPTSAGRAPRRQRSAALRTP